MARHITISTLGPESLQFGPEGKLHGQEALDRMLAHWRDLIDRVLPDEPDLIVVPEACDRFLEHSTEERLDYYRFRGDTVRDFFADVARDNGCYVAYSAVREMDDGTWRNSTQIIDRGGHVAGIYNKNHVVVEETTEYGVLCGKDAPIIECDFGRVACAICFDLNFDEVRLKYAKERPDLVVFCSMYHGGLMQAYWAYSCRAHFVTAVAGAPSAILSPVGETIATTTNYFPYVTARVNLDCKVVHLDYNWDKLRAAKVKYGRGVTIADPGHLGCVLLTCEMDDTTVDDVIREFDIEIWDDYMARALAHHHDPANIEP
ncbi:MAG: carbon-nitrogen hydrolase family protein [bacterium]|nr:carbon-nitrogen hydrolase family protein [bacterium]